MRNQGADHSPSQTAASTKRLVESRLELQETRRKARETIERARRVTYQPMGVEKRTAPIA